MEVTEKTRIGAKNRRKQQSYKKIVPLIRASTPAESGYSSSAEPSELHVATYSLKKCSVVLDTLIEEKLQENSTRRSGRIIGFNDKKAKDWMLTQSLVEKKLITKENVETEKFMWLPMLKVKRLTTQQIENQMNPWGFLKSKNFVTQITLKANVKSHRRLKGGVEEVYVEWTPTGILEDCWMKKCKFPKNGSKTCDLQNLRWDQKKRLTDRQLIQGL